MRIASSNLRVRRFNPWVTSSNPRVTSSNPWVTSSNPRVSRLLRFLKLKTQVERLKAGVQTKPQVK